MEEASISSLDLKNKTSKTPVHSPCVEPVHHGVASTSPAVTTASASAVTALKDIAFGSFAGIVGKVIEYPFDTIKVRLQAQEVSSSRHQRYSGPLDCFRVALRADGWAGLYRGLSVPMVGAAAEMSSLFFSYRLIQDAYKALLLPDAGSVPFSGLLVCGALSGTFTSLVLTPIELVKCKIQVATTANAAPPTISGIVRHVYAHQGALGFWHGQMGTLIRETGGSAAWFGTFEAAKLVFQARNRATSSHSKPLDKGQDGGDGLLLWQRLVAGAAAGVNYNFLFYPADTVKSRMQTQRVETRLDAAPRASFVHVAADLWKTQGLVGFYRGCGITAVRSVPSSALIFTIHDALMKYFTAN